MEGSNAGWFPKSMGGKVLQAGVYTAELKSVNPGVGKGYGEKETRATIMFSFQELDTGAVINRTVTASNSEKSQCVALVRGMAGNQLTPAIIGDGEAFQKFIMGLIGRNFLIQVQPSADNRYNNLITAFPASK